MHDIAWTVLQMTAPTSEPLTTAEVMAHCRIDIDEGDMVSAYIAAARWLAETIADCQLMPATWKLYMDEFPDEIRVPRPPLSSVTSITYVDSTGTTQTLSSALYSVDTFSRPGRIVPAYGETWPSTRGTQNDVIVTFVAGFGSTNDAAVGAMPKELKLGMLHLVAHWYENREPVNIGNIVNPLPLAGETLIRSRWHGWQW